MAGLCRPELFLTAMGKFCSQVFGGQTTVPTAWLKLLPNCRAEEILNFSVKKYCIGSTLFACPPATQLTA